MPFKKSDYPENWKEIAYKIKSEANWKCQKCGAEQNKFKGIVITVHHKDNNPMNCNKSNLIALCQKCHLYEQKVISGRLEYQKKELMGQKNLLHGNILAGK